MKFMTSGPSHILVLTKGETGEGIIEEWRELLGPPTVEEAKDAAPERSVVNYFLLPYMPFSCYGTLVISVHLQNFFLEKQNIKMFRCNNTVHVCHLSFIFAVYGHSSAKRIMSTPYTAVTLLTQQ